MKQEKNKGIAYALEILFPFGLSWFYVGKITHGVIHLIAGLLSLPFIIRALWLTIWGWMLQIEDSVKYSVDALWDNAPWIPIIILIYTIWMVIDCIMLNDAVNNCNEQIKKENEIFLNMMHGKGTIDNINIQSHLTSFKTKVEERQEINDNILKLVIEKVIKKNDFQNFKSNYFKITNNIENKQLKRGFQLLEDKQYELALKYFEDVLLNDNDNSLIYLGRSMAVLEINTPEEMIYYYQSLQKNNDFRRGEFIEDEGHKLYEEFMKIIKSIQKQYEATMVYNKISKNEKQMNYDDIMEALNPYKNELKPKIFDELHDKRQRLYTEAKKLEKTVESEKKKSLVYQTIYQNYTWCGQYKDAVKLAKEYKEKYIEANNKETKQKKIRNIVITISIIIVIVGGSWGSYVAYKNAKKVEAIQSLDNLTQNQVYVVRKYCKQNRIDPKDFIWYVNHPNYTDGDSNTVDIAYKSTNLICNYPSNEELNHNNKHYQVANYNSSVWESEDNSLDAD